MTLYDTVLLVAFLTVVVCGGVLGLVLAAKMIAAHKAAGLPVRHNGEWIGPDHPDYPR